jgi:hypothetical protein
VKALSALQWQPFLLHLLVSHTYGAACFPARALFLPCSPLSC